MQRDEMMQKIGKETEIHCPFIVDSVSQEGPISDSLCLGFAVEGQKHLTGNTTLEQTQAKTQRGTP